MMHTVDSPAHYNAGDIETIDIIMDVTKNLDGNEAVLVSNILRYICRYKYKNGVEDVRKARWYINRLIDDLSEEEFRAEVSE